MHFHKTYIFQVTIVSSDSEDKRVGASPLWDGGIVRSLPKHWWLVVDVLNVDSDLCCSCLNNAAQEVISSHSKAVRVSLFTILQRPVYGITPDLAIHYITCTPTSTVYLFRCFMSPSNISKPFQAALIH